LPAFNEKVLNQEWIFIFGSVKITSEIEEKHYAQILC